MWTFNYKTMNNFRFQLEKYNGLKTRYHCPNCNKKEFVRYLDNYSNEHINSIVGRCNREEKCGYHFTPRQYFLNRIVPSGKIPLAQIIRKPEVPVYYFDKNIITSTLGNKLNDSNLYRYLISKFSKDKVDQTFEKYLVGTSNKWQDSTIFWQVDSDYRIRAGKIMNYNSKTGRREKNKISWYKTPDGFKMEQCLFGLHLLQTSPKNAKIGIVESEKTALICDIAFGGDIIWLSSCGLRGLNRDKIKELKNREIILFPDLSPESSKVNAFKIWQLKAATISINLNVAIRVSTYLEEIATDKQREEQWDLGDFLLQ